MCILFIQFISRSQIMLCFACIGSLVFWDKQKKCNIINSRNSRKRYFEELRRKIVLWTFCNMFYFSETQLTTSDKYLSSYSIIINEYLSSDKYLSSYSIIINEYFVHTVTLKWIHPGLFWPDPDLTYQGGCNRTRICKKISGIQICNIVLMC